MLTHASSSLYCSINQKPKAMAGEKKRGNKNVFFVDFGVKREVNVKHCVFVVVSALNCTPLCV